MISPSYSNRNEAYTGLLVKKKKMERKTERNIKVEKQVDLRGEERKRKRKMNTYILHT